MVRRSGRLESVGWDEALQTFSQRLGEVRSRGGAANAVFINQHESGSFPGFLDAWLAGFGMPRNVEIEHVTARGLAGWDAASCQPDGRWW